MNWSNALIAAGVIAAGLALSMLGTIGLEMMKERFGEGFVLLFLLSVLVAMALAVGLLT